MGPVLVPPDTARMWTFFARGLIVGPLGHCIDPSWTIRYESISQSITESIRGRREHWPGERGVFVMTEGFAAPETDRGGVCDA
ncbi:hypothetical protein HUW46_09205 [Amycolatopsis sp. CA-230715]|nr:hypothetical protein HUW46_09205 [Amycolatopsis sp. CA-230715]